MSFQLDKLPFAAFFVRLIHLQNRPPPVRSELFIATYFLEIHGRLFSVLLLTVYPLTCGGAPCQAQIYSWVFFFPLRSGGRGHLHNVLGPKTFSCSCVFIQRRLNAPAVLWWITGLLLQPCFLDPVHGEKRGFLQTVWPELLSSRRWRRYVSLK